MIFFTSLILWAIITGIFMLKKMSPAQIIISLLTGCAAFVAADIIMSLYGGNMPVNAYTLSISAAGGLPGVILLILLKTFFL